MASGQETIRWRPAGWQIALAGCLVVVAVQTIVLRVLHVPLGLQLAVWLSLVIATAAGWMVTRPLAAHVGEFEARAAMALLAGVILSAMTFYLFRHRRVADALGLGDLRAIGLASMALVVLIGVVAAVVFRSHERRPVMGSPIPIVVALVLALAMSAGTIYGGVNSTELKSRGATEILAKLSPEHPLSSSTTQEWGFASDYYSHFVIFTRQVARSGLPVPSKDLTHRHVQHWALSLTTAFDGYEFSDPVQAMKVASVPLWTALLLLAWTAALTVFRLTPQLASIVILSIMFFAPVRFPPWDFSASSYRGFIGTSGSIYHNVPQLLVVAIGMAAVLLIGRMSRDGTLLAVPYAAACGVIAMSFWFKPSLFIIFGPALGLVSLVWLRRLPKTVLAGWALLALPIIWRFAYTAVTGIPYEELTVAIEPLAGYETFAAKKLPGFLASNTVVLAISVVVLSFLAWLIPLGVWLRRSWPAVRGGLRRWLEGIRTAAPQAVVAIALLLGLLAAFLFVETGRKRDHGNMAWPVMSASLLSLPILVRLTSDIGSQRLRCINWGIIGLHLLAGAVHMYRLVVWQTI